MYIGGTGSQGLMHLVWELIDNAVDEAAAGHATRIDVTLHRDQTVEVADNGRGIPIDEHAKRKVSALEVVFTELHAGGKFGGGAYGASGGLHGVGASVVNARSSRLVAQVDREGHTWELAFRNRVAGQLDDGKFKAGHGLRKVKRISKTKTGTRVRFLPDRELFDAEAGIDVDEVCDRVTRSCYLVPGLKVRVHDKRSGGRREAFEWKGFENNRGGVGAYGTYWFDWYWEKPVDIGAPALIVEPATGRIPAPAALQIKNPSQRPVGLHCRLFPRVSGSYPDQ